MPIINYDLMNHPTNAMSYANDDTLNSIFSNGYVKNTKLHRRWITAQILKAMKTPNGGYDAWINNVDDAYIFKVMADEANVLAHLDQSTLSEREKFFNKDVIVKTVKDYYEFLSSSSSWRTYNNGLGYRNSPSVADSNVRGIMSQIESTDSYGEISKLLNKIPTDRKGKSFISSAVDWKNAFKGAGSYYALKNLVMWDGCKINGWDRDESLEFIETKMNDGRYDILFMLLKQTVNQNSFDLKTFLSNN